MKTLKTLLSIFAIAAVFSAGAYAQETANVAVSTTVETALTLTPTAVALGTIQQASSTLDANTNDGATEVNIGTTASAGALRIQGSAGVAVDVSWVDATLDNGSDPISFTASVYNGSTSVASGDDVTLVGGDITLDIGGTLAAPSGTGLYNTTLGSGTPIAFTVSYN